eukprot:6138892-Pleurochrysis_carterae.AAC.1
MQPYGSDSNPERPLLVELNVDTADALSTVCPLLRHDYSCAAIPRPQPSPSCEWRIQPTRMTAPARLWRKILTHYP